MSAADPVFARYLIAPVIIDGPVLPPGEAEFRIIGTIAAAEDTDMPGQDPEPLRFRVTDWAGPYLPQDVVFEVRVVVLPPEPSVGREDYVYGPTRGTYTEALADVAEHFLITPGDGIEWFIESRVAHEWKCHDPASFGLPDPDERVEGVCGRVLVGRGSDTFDPCCILPPDHEGICKP